MKLFLNDWVEAKKNEHFTSVVYYCLIIVMLHLLSDQTGASALLLLEEKTFYLSILCTSSAMA
uniref:Uncharacterized protein n=1 Tax=Octopus bimaculoides TaxID=37653 RepID=A0A0L8GK49_OCTBM